MKAAAKFTRDNPCTKVHLWNCFRTATGYATVTVVEAKMNIGDNAPKYMLKSGYLRQYMRAGVDYYVLTPEGIEWLEAGIVRHLELHPEDYQDCVFSPPGIKPKAPRAPAPKASGSSVIIRRRR